MRYEVERKLYELSSFTLEEIAGSFLELEEKVGELESRVAALEDAVEDRDGRD